jgi:ferredoxin
MKNIIFCFSGTGNSLNAAKKLCEGLKDCKIVSMTHDYDITNEYDRIGFVFPCYWFGLPNLVKKFIRSLDFSLNKNTYYFSVVTCGVIAGNSYLQINSILKQKEIRLNYFNYLPVVDNSVIYMTKNIDEKIVKSDKELTFISKEIFDKIDKKNYKNNFILAIIHNIMSKKYGKMGKNFNVADSCNGCKTCTKVCPVNNITIENNRPVFNSKCEQCMACIQWCPQEAINYKTKTQLKKRYHHPNIKIQEIMTIR